MENKVIKKGIKKWEKTFEEKMNSEKKRMFIWGFVFGIEKGVNELKKVWKDGDNKK